MEQPYEYLLDGISPAFTNILKFLLIQDPVKIAVGFALGLSISNVFTEIIGNLIKPIIHLILHFFSKSGFNYNILGTSFNIGNMFEQIIIFFIFILVLYYGFIVPINNLKTKYNITQQTFKCPYCTTLISPTATRCPACTSDIDPNLNKILI